MDATRYRWVGFQLTGDGRVVAECDCGWASSPCPSAAEAGACSDSHRAGLADHHQPGRRRG